MTDTDDPPQHPPVETEGEADRSSGEDRSPVLYQTTEKYGPGDFVEVWYNMNHAQMRGFRKVHLLHRVREKSESYAYRKKSETYNSGYREESGGYGYGYREESGYGYGSGSGSYREDEPGYGYGRENGLQKCPLQKTAPVFGMAQGWVSARVSAVADDGSVTVILEGTGTHVWHCHFLAMNLLT